MIKTILDHHGIPHKMENTENGVRFNTIFPEAAMPEQFFVCMHLAVWRF